MIHIYSGESVSDSHILDSVETKFGVHIDDSERERIILLRIHSAPLLHPRWYPVLTMLGQSLGSIIVAFECVCLLRPALLIDSCGCAFTYPVFNAVGSRVLAYVHYPIISTDMFDKVGAQRPQLGRAVGAGTRTRLKLLYYRAFACMYGAVGAFADAAMVNSSWTEAHIRQIWTRCGRIVKVFPPCNSEALASLSLDGPRSRRVLSIGQFRPEKDHKLQIAAFRRLQETDARFADVELVVMGSTRNKEDRALVEALLHFARTHCEGDVCKLRQLTTEDSGTTLRRSVDGIHFVVDADYDEVRRMLATASVGLHSMWNEHFGISIVEMLAAGLIVVAHNSGGPKLDILCGLVESRAGFLAATVEEYADSLAAALDGAASPRATQARHEARSAADRFSDSAFSKSVVDEVLSLLRTS